MLSVARLIVTVLTLQYTLRWGAAHGQSFAPVKLVAIGVPVASHWFQLQAVIEGVLTRGHQVKVRCVHALRALSRCATLWRALLPLAHRHHDTGIPPMSCIAILMQFNSNLGAITCQAGADHSSLH